MFSVKCYEMSMSPLPALNEPVTQYAQDTELTYREVLLLSNIRMFNEVECNCIWYITHTHTNVQHDCTHTHSNVRQRTSTYVLKLDNHRQFYVAMNPEHIKYNTQVATVWHLLSFACTPDPNRGEGSAPKRAPSR
jgi:hypothetical protein